MQAKLKLWKLLVILSGILLLSEKVVLAAPWPSEDELVTINYYVKIGDTFAKEIEIERLKKKYPDWRLGLENPMKVRMEIGNIKEPIDKIYQLIAQRKLAEARKKLKKTQIDFPNWSPDEELKKQFRITQAQEDYEVSLKKMNLFEAQVILKNNIELSSCERINNLWRLAHALEKDNNATEAKAIYFQILRRCKNNSTLVSTIEKAEPILTDIELKQTILDLNKVNSFNNSEYKNLYKRLSAGREAKKNAKVKKALALTKAKPKVRILKKPFKQNNTAFKINFDSLSLKDDPRKNEIISAMDATNWGSCLARSVNPQTTIAALLRGWCAYNYDRPIEAMALFKSVEKSKSNKAIKEDARFGLVLSLLELDLIKDASVVVASGFLSNSRLRTAEIAILQKRGIRSYYNKNWNDAIEYFNELERLGGLDRDMDILRSKSYGKKGDIIRAISENSRIYGEFNN